jgi:signal transduction histidine kinase
VRVATDTDRPSPDTELATLRAEVARLREEERRAAQMIRELGEAVAARDAFIAIAGHELRNPMGAIIVAATSLAHAVGRIAEDVPAWLPARVALLERQARLFVRRATTLLDVSRITSGQLRLDPELVDLAQAARDSLEYLAVEMERAHVTVTTSIEDELCGWWDRVAIDQILYNLLSNAIKYGAGKPIHVSLASSGGRATLSVADRGIGISPADRDRIFGRFERAVTQRTHGGFGLGLWITHNLVEACGGTIRVESDSTAGSIFTVELPQTVEPQPR